MKPPWYASREILPWLFLVATALAITVVIKEELVTSAGIAAQKDVVDVATNVLGAFILSVGGLLSYIRFFRGRTLRPKLDVSPTAGVIEGEEKNFHWIDVQIENRGSVAVWNHGIKIFATLHGNELHRVEVMDFVPPRGEKPESDHLIDVGESYHEHAFHYVSKKYHAVTYEITIKDKAGTVWERGVTCANADSK